MITKYLLCWFLLALAAIANGIVRQATYGKVMSDLSAHQLSTVTGIVATGILVWGLSKLWPLESQSQALLIGAFWLAFTIIFEFTFGRLVAGHSWDKLFADYNIFEGRVWSVFLICLAMMPYFFFRYGKG